MSKRIYCLQTHFIDVKVNTLISYGNFVELNNRKRHHMK